MQRRAKRYVRSDVLGRSENLIQHRRVGSIYLVKRVKKSSYQPDSSIPVYACTTRLTDLINMSYLCSH